MAEHQLQQTIGVFWYAVLFGLLFIALRYSIQGLFFVFEAEQKTHFELESVALAALLVSLVFIVQQRRGPYIDEVWPLALWSLAIVLLVDVGEYAVKLALSLEKAPALPINSDQYGLVFLSLIGDGIRLWFTATLQLLTLALIYGPISFVLGFVGRQIQRLR